MAFHPLQDQLCFFKNFYYLFFAVRIPYLISTNRINNKERDRKRAETNF